MRQLEAAQKWVNGFNAVPTPMIAKLMQADPDDWHEVTYPTVGDHVYVLYVNIGEVISVCDRECCQVRFRDGSIWQGAVSDVVIQHEDDLPMWGTMWSFGDSCDEDWLDEEDGIALMSQCGFRIFKSEEFGYYFGIDGAGYNFYEAHWLPLYKARGLKWHDEEVTPCD